MTVKAASATRKLPFAETVNYWKTGRSSPDVWLSRTIELLKKLGAQDIAEAFGACNGRGAYILAFKLGEDAFRIAWPVLPCRKISDEAAARVQAATLLYHDCKAKALAAAVLGSRAAFIGALLLPDGQTVTETSLPELASHLRPVALLH